MGLHREFDFQQDIELLNLKYKLDNGNFLNFENEEILQSQTKEIQSNLDNKPQI